MGSVAQRRSGFRAEHDGQMPDARQNTLHLGVQMRAELIECQEPLALGFQGLSQLDERVAIKNDLVIGGDVPDNLGGEDEASRHV